MSSKASTHLLQSDPLHSVSSLDHPFCFPPRLFRRITIRRTIAKPVQLVQALPKFHESPWPRRHIYSTPVQNTDVYAPPQRITRTHPEPLVPIRTRSQMTVFLGGDDKTRGCLQTPMLPSNWEAGVVETKQGLPLA